MESLYSVKLGKLIQEFRLEVLRGGAAGCRTKAFPGWHSGAWSWSSRC